MWRPGLCYRPLLFWRPEHALSSWQVIEAGVKVGENKAPAVFADIQKGSANLKKTETNDKSAPVIEAGEVTHEQRRGGFVIVPVPMVVYRQIIAYVDGH